MKIQIASDLHLEMHADRGKQFLENLAQQEADVLVLAGDITSARFSDSLDLTFGILCPKVRDIIYVPGNHEYYMTTFSKADWAIIEAVKRRKNVHLLRNSSVEIGGKLFYGGTGWFPQKKDGRTMNARHFMNDFRLITGLEPKIYELNTEFKENLNKVKAQGRLPDVIVSHHMPIEKCIHNDYAGSPLNAFFLADVDVKSSGAKLWICGHTHKRFDMMEGTTRIVCNPFGYPNETASQEEFERDLIVEI